MYSQYLLFSLQLTVYISHDLGNSQIFKLTWRVSFSYVRKTSIKSYFLRGLRRTQIRE